jgi:hypothetical protein
MGLILPHAPQFSLYESNLPATPSPGAPGTAVNHYVTTVHTKDTTCTELIAASAFDASLVVVGVSANSVANGDSSTLTDIMIGAASAESVIIPDLCSGFVPAANVAAGVRHYIFPLYIPAGSRLSARSQSVRNTGSVVVSVQLYGGPRDPASWWCGQQVTAYGANAANSAGTKFSTGSTGSEGAGVSLGTTTSDHECLVLGVQGHPDDVSWSAHAYHFDIGIDSSATEWIETDRIFANSTSAEIIGPGGTIWWPIFRPVASGTVLMVRGECDAIADALSAVIYGVS